MRRQFCHPTHLWSVPVTSRIFVIALCFSDQRLWWNSNRIMTPIALIIGTGWEICKLRQTHGCISEMIQGVLIVTVKHCLMSLRDEQRSFYLLGTFLSPVFWEIQHTSPVTLVTMIRCHACATVCAAIFELKNCLTWYADLSTPNS